jgi:hypothetical protein
MKRYFTSPITPLPGVKDRHLPAWMAHARNPRCNRSNDAGYSSKQAGLGRKGSNCGIPAKKCCTYMSFGLVAFLSSASSDVNLTRTIKCTFLLPTCRKAAGRPTALRYCSTKPANCGKYEEPFLMIGIIGNLPKAAPHDYTMGSGGRVLASRCQSRGHCETATTGVLHLTKFSQQERLR